MVSRSLSRRTVWAFALWSVALVGSSGFAVGLLALRVHRTGSLQWSFMVTNLALAWAPLAFALLVWLAARARTSRLLLLPPALLWLLFLPNAPYLWTDLVHLAGHPNALFVNDLVLLGSFAVAGLLAGFASLYLVQSAFERRFGATCGWMVVLASLPLAAVGVYIGRVWRWNSWEAPNRLGQLLELIRMRLTDPLGNPFFIEVCLLMTAALAAGYLVCFALTRLLVGGSAAGTTRARRSGF